MNKSLAIWYSPREGTAEVPGLELHFNFWKLKNSKGLKRGFHYFLDIGLMVSDITLIKDIFIYFPFKLLESKNEIVNLGELFSNGMLLTSVFNERAKINPHTVESPQGGGEKEIYKLKKVELFPEDKEKVNFLIYSFEEDDFNIQNIGSGEEGSILKFNMEKDYFKPGIQTKKVYFRFRLSLTPAKSDVFIFESSPWDRWILSSVNKNDFLDFRINERRNIPENLQDEKMEHLFRNDKIHFFHMRAGDDDLIIQSKNFIGYRELEAQIWSEYVNYKNEKNTTLNKVFAYHWKEKKGEDNKIGFSMAAKFQCQESSFLNLFRNFIWLLGVSIIGGIAAVLFMSSIQNKTNEEANSPVPLYEGETQPPLPQPLEEEPPPQPPLQEGEN